jgi:hypothetical protein
MRLPFDCGCDDRKEIMFTAGKLGLPEAAILAGFALLVIVCYQVGKEYR